MNIYTLILWKYIKCSEKRLYFVRYWRFFVVIGSDFLKNGIDIKK